MAEREIATALELMQGGLKFEHDADGWYWAMGDMASGYCATEFTAVVNFCQWYAQIRTVKDAPQPAAFDLDAFMMDGIEALVKAAAEEMRARGEYFDPETVAGALAEAWHYAPYTGDPHEDARPVSTDFL